MLSALWNKCKEIRLKLVLLLGVIIVDAFLAAISISLILPVANASFKTEESGVSEYITKFLPESFNGDVYMLLLALAFLLFIKFAVAFVKTIYSIRLAENLQLSWQKDLTHQIMKLPYKLVASEQHGKVINSLVQETSQACNFVFNYLVFMSQLTVSVSVVATLFIVNWVWIGSILIVAIIAWFTVGRIFFLLAARLGKNSIKLKQKLNNVVIESLRGIKDIKISNSETLQIAKVYERASDLNKNNIAMRIAQSLPVLGKDLVFAMIIVLIVVFMPRDVEAVKTLMPQIALFLVAFAQLATNLSAISTLRFKIVQKFESFKLISELLDETKSAQMEDLYKGNEITDIGDKITLKDIEFDYDENAPILKGLNLEIKRGEVICISGPSGSGKTTLMDLITRLYTPRAGIMSSNAGDIQQGSLASWRKLIGYVPQDPVIYYGSIKDNITLEHENVSDQDVMDACVTAELIEDINAMPDGLDTKLHEGGSNLSGGQRKRLALARAIAHKSQMIILDETTNAIPELLEKKIIENLREKQVSVIIISHRESTYEIVDRTYQMQNGKLALLES
jgi:ABC-type bacteriocin/lantibiotic exporter with double-glycine peptidase domain